MAKGNASLRVADNSPGPWVSWKGSRVSRFIRFTETYLRAPRGAGFGEPLKLLQWEKDFSEGFLADHVTAGGLSVARGAGKSTFMAALAAFAGYEEGDTGSAVVPIVAVSLAQAKAAIYSTVVSMVNNEPELSDRSLLFYGIGTERILIPRTESTIFPRSSDPSSLQGLDVTLGLVDEWGFVNLEAWNAILMGRKRPGARVLGAGTFGPDRGSPLYQIRKVIRDGGAPPSFYYQEYSGTPGVPVDDESNWRLANPSLDAGFPDLAFLRNAAQMTPEPLFRTFHLNEPDVVGHDSWLGPDARTIWAGLNDPYELQDKAPTWVGVDIGLVRDSTAVVCVQERPDGRLHAKARIWMPSPGETVDIAEVVQHLRDLSSQYDVRAISFDPRLFELAARMLIDEGLPLVEIPQSVERMTPIIGSLYELIRKGALSHGEDEREDATFGDQIINAVPRLNERGFTLSKSKSAPRGHIDGAIALALAVDRAQHRERPRPPIVVL